jgi:hypothetical protein
MKRMLCLRSCNFLHFKKTTFAFLKPEFNMKKYISLFAIIAFLTACKTTNNINTEKRFKSIFDGQTLKGWAGDMTYWRVEDGSIIGEITPSTTLKTNSFLTYQGGQPADFELKAEFNITEKGNSGIQYRSVIFPDAPNALKGYQADIDGKNTYTGQNYEERGRTTLAYRGQITNIPAPKANSKSINNAWSELTVSGTLGNADELKSKIKASDWNEMHLVIKGNRLQHYVNGVLMSDVTDNDVMNGKSKGYLGVQVHVGPPMKVMFRNIRLKKL